MTSRSKEKFFEWVREGLDLSDIELIYEAMWDYFKDGSEYWKIEKNKQNKAEFPLYQLVQALVSLRDTDKKEGLDRLLNSQKTGKVIALQEWKNKKQYFRTSA